MNSLKIEKRAINSLRNVIDSHDLMDENINDNDLLRGSEEKRPEQTKSIALKRLAKNDAYELHKILLQFGHDSAEQGTGELVRKSIRFEDMEKIDELRATGYAENQEELLRNITSGEICLFGHMVDADIWLPFSYEDQRNMRIVNRITVNKPIVVNGRVCYDSFELEKQEDGDYCMYLSENLSADMQKGTFHFKGISTLDIVQRDIVFLQELQKSEEIFVDGEVLAQYGGLTPDQSMEEQIEGMQQIISAFGKAGVSCDKRLDAMTEGDWKAITQLEKLYLGEIRPKEESAWYIWEWNDRVVPFFLMKYPDGKVVAENILNAKDFAIMIGEGDKSYRLPRYIHFKKDIWEKLYDVKEEVLLEDLEECDFNKVTEEYMSLLLLEILSAYDCTHNEKYYDLSMLLANKILAANPQCDNWKINRLQVLKRKRELSEEELGELEQMECAGSNLMVKCAANILLENKYKAHKQLENMTEEDRKLFQSYPIYHLSGDMGEGVLPRS